MCLILFAYQNHSVYKLILGANRDEFYDRPSAPMAFWDQAPDVLAGRDLKAGGTWFGIARDGRWGAITNFRDPARSKAEAVSRGLLVSRYLLGTTSPYDYLEPLKREADHYNGFNLLVGSPQSLYYFSNRSAVFRRLPGGTYGLSNHQINTPWPKVVQGRAALTKVIMKTKIDVDDLFAILSDRSQPDEAKLPNTGVGRQWEKILSPRFIATPVYGTRSSTVVLIDYENNVQVHEKTFGPELDDPEYRTFEFRITQGAL